MGFLILFRYLLLLIYESLISFSQSVGGADGSSGDFGNHTRQEKIKISCRFDNFLTIISSDVAMFVINATEIMKARVKH